ncbi:MAG: hypothetical protein [Bacteriophage sp.]|nr:MAG: hypothetical protein [Bacteriophage sp.]
MAYVTTAWGRPIQGVSQQPDRIRQEGQCTKQENAIPDVVKGLTKRPSTNYIDKILDRSLPSNSAFHSYDRGDEQYFMFVEPDSNIIRVFNLEGEQQPVTISDGNYLSTARPDLTLDFTTVGDTTFITNRSVPVLMSGELTPALQNIGIVYSQFATYGKTYKIIIDGVTVAAYKTPNGSQPSHIDFVATDWIANVLYKQIAGGTYTDVDGEKIYPENPLYDATLREHTIWISKKDGGDFKLSTADSQKGEDLITAKGTVKSTTQLPSYAPDGFILRITGEGKSTKDDYWLKAVNSMEGTVRWVETTEPSIPSSFNVYSMPHVLVRESIDVNGTASFSFATAPFESRQIGGEDSNPLPGFIDVDNPLPINSTGVFQNRLFFLSGETIIMSRSNLFFNFWRETSQTASDTDPLEGYADTDRVNNLYNYQILNGDLVIFSERAQFIIKGSVPVTKANLTLSQVTAYPSLVNVKPQAAGENVFFAYDAAGYTGIRELFTDNYSDTKKAYPATDYVSKYIPDQCEQLLATPSLNTMLVRSARDLTRLYIYDWLWQDNQKVQSAWHSWVMDGEVLYVFYVDDRLYFVYRNKGKTYLDYMHMLNDPSTVNLSYSTKLDHRVSVDAIYNPSTGKYMITLPYERSDVVLTISVGGHPADEGSAFTATYIGNGVWESSSDLSPNKGNLKVIAGVKFTFSYIPTQPVVKDFRERVIGLQSIIMSNLYIHYEITGDIKVTATPKHGGPRDYHFSGRYMGTAENLVGSPILDNGTYRVPIRQRAEDMEIEIYSDSHYPLTIRDMEMDGTFHQRGQRI